MPAALRAGMDCQTFWRSNPKRLNQFFETYEPLKDADIHAWATGYYVACAFGGKLPKEPNLFKPSEEEMSTEDFTQKWLNWAAVQQARLIDKEIEEARQNG